MNPNWAFAYSDNYKNVTIYSDKVIGKNIEERIDSALDRLNRSELFDPKMHFNMYFCCNPPISNGAAK